MKKTLWMIIFFSIVIIFGCNQNKTTGSKDPGASPPSSISPVAVDQKGDVDPIADTNARSGGTLNEWGSGFPKSLNAWLDNNSLSTEVMGLLFESLVTLHSTKNEPVGILAESWNVSADGRKFTFKINPKARWSDGRPVTAEDVQFYYDIIMDPKNMTSVFRVDLKRFKRPQVLDDKTILIEAQETHWSNFWAAAGFTACAIRGAAAPSLVRVSLHSAWPEARTLRTASSRLLRSRLTSSCFFKGRQRQVMATACWGRMV